MATTSGSTLDDASAVDWRPDGRASCDFRTTRFQTAVIAGADGSCIYEQGNAKVICAVFGPLQRFRMRKLEDAAVLRCHLYRSRFADADRVKGRARADKETHQILEQALAELVLLENYPRTRIDIVFRVMQSDGKNVAVCMNAANFALMDAGICLRGILTAASCAYINERVIVDVCDQDDQDASGTVIIGSINGADEATFIDLRGCFGREVFKQVMTTALAANRRLHAAFARVAAAEVRRAHTVEPRPGAALGALDEAFAAIRVHEAGEAATVERVRVAEYDADFRQLISDSEDENDGDIELVELDKSTASIDDSVIVLD